MKRVCFVSGSGATEGERALALANCLAERFEVVFVDATRCLSAAPASAVTIVAAEPAASGFAFANDEHRLGAAVLAAIASAYDDGRAPDYLEVPDRGGLGLVALQARRGGSPLLATTRIGVRLTGTRELTDVHDGGAWEREATLIADLEREQLRLADLVVSPADEALELYRRVYDVLPAVAATVPEPLAPGRGVGDRSGDGPVRVLYRGPLARHRGVFDLATALLRFPGDGWELTLAGADTRTAPAGGSVRLTIEEMFGAADGRVRIAEEPRDPAGRDALHADHDLFVAPEPVRVWPIEALVALGAGLPVLATPIGGLPRLLADGGWTAPAPGPRGLATALDSVLAEPAAISAARGRGAEAVRRLCDPERVADAYAELLGEAVAPRTASRPRRRPLVTGVVPYYRTAAHVEEAVDSLLGQTYADLDVVLVNDGSFDRADEVLGRIAARPRVSVVTQLNAGDAAARTLGARLARGEYLVMLDADNVLEPRFVERALPVLLAEPELAYVSCWLRFIDAEGAPFTDPKGFAALGNRVVRDDTVNLDGDSLALVPQALFTDEGYEYDSACATHSDWALYRTLRAEGRFGAVIPEPLARYRVRADSLLRTYSSDLLDRGPGEIRDRVIARRAERLEATG